MQNLNQMKKGGGFSLIELIIVLGVISVLAGAIYYAKDRLFGSIDSQKEATTYFQLITVAQEGFGLASSYADVDADWLVGTGQVPPEWVDGTDIRNSYDGLVSIGPTGPGNRQLLLVSENVDSEDCQVIVRNMARGATLSMGTNGSKTNIKAEPSEEFDPVAAQNACNASDPVALNIVTN
jgi:prepilin-type N-terminal cleavage/methylation domain-containing protein